MKNDEAMLTFINNEMTRVPQTLNNKLTRKEKRFQCRKEFYKIKEFVDDFLEEDSLNRYLLLPGLRGVGKTTIIFQLYEYLIKEKNINQNQILYLSCEKLNEYFEFKILDVIETFLKYHHNSTISSLDTKILLFIDEAQYAPELFRAIKRIADSDNAKGKFFLTGSQSYELMSSASESLAGRISIVEMSGLSLREIFHIDFNNTFIPDDSYIHQLSAQIDLERHFSKI